MFNYKQGFQSRIWGTLPSTCMLHDKCQTVDCDKSKAQPFKGFNPVIQIIIIKEIWTINYIYIYIYIIKYVNTFWLVKYLCIILRSKT